MSYEKTSKLNQAISDAQLQMLKEYGKWICVSIPAVNDYEKGAEDVTKKLNEMEALGWNFIQMTSTCSNNSGTYHYLLFKRVNV